ncbi:unnamed protein product, partial [Prorocentrum cordatum]
MSPVGGALWAAECTLVPLRERVSESSSEWIREAIPVQQDRLREALLPAGEPGAGKASGQGLDLAHSVFHPRHPGYDHFVRLLPGACQ